MSTASVAKAFWLGNANQPLIALSTLSNAMRVTADFDADQVDDANNALQEDLTSRGLATDLISITNAYAEVKETSLDFWLGSYLLQAQSGHFLTLSLSSQNITLTDLSTSIVLVRTTADKATFAGQVFQYEDASLKLSFKLYFPSDLPALTKQTAAAPGVNDAARINDGVLQSKSAGGVNYTFTGKHNAFTPSGLTYQGHGDPLEVWHGTYVWRYTDGDYAYLHNLEITPAAEDGDYAYLHNLEITPAADDSVAVQFGTLTVDSPMLNNNTLVFTTSTGAQVAASLTCSPAGARSLNGVLVINGITRPVTGTANTAFAGSINGFTNGPVGKSAAQARRAATSPDFCATNNDQTVPMATLGRVVRPQLDPVAVTYADGSAGTVQVTPVRAMDVYTVPPGKFVTFHAPDVSGRPQSTDASLRIGWLLDSPLALRKMVEADYYQLRLSLTGWYYFDQSGIDISLAEDDSAAPGFISLTSAASTSCALGTGGAGSTISDFTKATTLVSNLKDASGKAVRNYRFLLTGRGTAKDNAAGTQSGFLKATLTFLDKDGKEKSPAQTVSLPMLYDASLPVDIQPPVMVTGGNTMPAAYQGQAYAASLRASAGMAPYRWMSAKDGSLPAGLAWSVAADAADRSVFQLQGTLKSVAADTVVSTWVTVQASPFEAVTRPHKIQVAISVRGVTKNPPPSYSVIVGGVVGSVAAAAAALLLIYAYNNRSKLSSDSRSYYERLKQGVAEKLEATTGFQMEALGKENRDFLSKNSEALQKSLEDQVNGAWDRMREMHVLVAEAQAAVDANSTPQNQDRLNALQSEAADVSSEANDLVRRLDGVNQARDGAFDKDK